MRTAAGSPDFLIAKALLGKGKSRKGRSTLLKILKRWARLNQRYVKATDGELAYSYNERANIGLLSAAVWKENQVALEEFGTIKGFRKVTKRDRSNWNGRGDLFLTLAPGVQAVIEAKFTRPKLGTKGWPYVWEQARAARARAHTDARATRKGRHGLRRMGLAFCVPRLRVPKDNRGAALLEAREALIAELKAGHHLGVNRAGRGANIDFWAAYVPEADPRRRDRGSYYLGVVLIGSTRFLEPKVWKKYPRA